MGNIGSVALVPNAEMKVGNKNPDSKSYTGFGAVLTTILNSNPSKSIENKLVKGDLLSQQELMDLTSFLGNQDIFNLENGSDVLDKLLSNTNINPEQIAKEMLGISEQELTSITEKLSRILKENDTLSKDDTTLFENMDDLVALLTAMQSLPIQEFKKIVDQDFAKLMKFTKLVDLLSKNQDTTWQSNSSISKLIESLTEKLEQVIKNSSSNFKSDYLQKTFTLLSGDLNKNISTSVKQVEGLESGNHFLQHMSKSEQLTLMLGDVKRPVSAEQLIQQFENLLAKSQFSKTEGMQRLFIKLAPEHLGSLRIELIQKDQMLVAKILTTTGAAKDSLESHLNGLKQALANQNIQVERIEISEQMSSQERSFQRDPEQHRREQEEQKKQQEKSDSNGEFTQSFLEALELEA
ncbi:flagellar hook-length control protein FliK [Neobacillus sp. D3-1R]|uniref:flagellar hook-length control protein FliK n=1 Tax=Neobacillus sp. D3-1R TaxID=3445778 RepID=UPI003FA0B993